MTTRLEFSVKDLRAQVDAKRDARIAEIVEAYEREVDLVARHDAWRTEQEKRIRSLARRLGGVPDNELESFRIPSCPRNDRYSSPEQNRDVEIERANARHARAVGRLEVVRTNNGVVSLTSNMLADWFGL